MKESIYLTVLLAAIGFVIFVVIGIITGMFNISNETAKQKQNKCRTQETLILDKCYLTSSLHSWNDETFLKIEQIK